VVQNFQRSNYRALFGNSIRGASSQKPIEHCTIDRGRFGHRDGLSAIAWNGRGNSGNRSETRGTDLGSPDSDPTEKPQAPPYAGYCATYSRTFVSNDNHNLLPEHLHSQQRLDASTLRLRVRASEGRLQKGLPNPTKLYNAFAAHRFARPRLECAFTMEPHTETIVQTKNQPH